MSTEAAATPKTNLAPVFFITGLCLLFTGLATYYKYADPYGRYSAEPKPAELIELERQQQEAAKENPAAKDIVPGHP